MMYLGCHPTSDQNDYYYFYASCWNYHLDPTVFWIQCSEFIYEVDENRVLVLPKWLDFVAV